MDAVRNTFFTRLCTMPVHEIPTDFDKPFVDNLIDSFFENFTFSSLDEIASFLESSRLEKPEFLWTVYLRMASRLLAECCGDSLPKILKFLEKYREELHANQCTIVQQLRFELFLVLTNHGIKVDCATSEAIDRLSQETTNIFIRPVIEQLAVAIFENKPPIERMELLPIFVEILVTSDYPIIENSLSTVLTSDEVLKSLNDDQSRAILKKTRGNPRAGLALCKLAAKIIVQKANISWSQVNNAGFSCRRTQITVLQEMISLGSAKLEELYAFYTDSELGQLFLYLETQPQKRLDRNLLRTFIERALDFHQQATKPFSDSEFEAFFKVMHFCDFTSSEYIQVIRKLQNWLAYRPQILGFPPTSMHKAIYTDSELKIILANLVMTKVLAEEWESRDAAVEMLSIVGNFLNLDDGLIFDRLLDLAKQDECNYVRISSLKYLIYRFPDDLMPKVTELYKVNLDSDFRALLLDFLQTRPATLTALVTIVEETLNHEDDPGILEKVATVCETSPQYIRDEPKLQGLFIQLQSEIAIGHHERNQRKWNRDDARAQVEDMVETMEKVAMTGIDDCIIKECY